MNEAQRVQIGDWTATPALNLLEREGRSLKLEPRAMEVLVHLADHAGEVVSADDLIRSVWQARVVGDGVVYQSINQLRNALGDHADKPRFIETIPKRGYRLIARVERHEPRANEKPLPTGVERHAETTGWPSVWQKGKSFTRERLAWAMAGGAAIAAVILGLEHSGTNDPDTTPARFSATRSTASPSDDRPVVAGTVPLPATAPLASGTSPIGFDSPLIALSPDSKWLLYVGRSESGSMLYRRNLGAFDDPVPIPGTEGVIFPFFSPDGGFVGFLTAERLRRVSLEGDNLQTIASTRTAVRASWTEDGWIYMTDDQGYNLRRVRTSGGEVEDVIIDSGFRFSEVLPDGRFALATARVRSISGDYASLVSIDLRTLEPQDLGILGYDARWVPTGHLLFGRSGNVLAVPFDPERGLAVGDPVSLLQGVAMDSLFGHVQLAFSAQGALAYVPGTDRAIGHIVAVDRQGVLRAMGIPPGRYGVLDLSPDDRQIAVHVADVRDYVWIYDVASGRGRKLASSDGYGWPKWNTDGTALAFSSGYAKAGERQILIQAATSSGAPESLLVSEEVWAVTDWSPTSDDIAVGARTPFRFGFVSRGGEATIRWVDDLPGTEWGTVFSPDARWVAYTSDETGRFEVWVRSYPEGDDRRQVSLSGGLEPVWCRCGEIFFRKGNQFWSTAIQSEHELAFGAERLAFTVTDFLDTPGTSYDVSSNGEKLFVVQRTEPAVEDRIYVMANWSEELIERARVP